MAKQAETAHLRLTAAELLQGLTLPAGPRYIVTVTPTRLERARWSAETARCGEEVKLRVDVPGAVDGCTVRFDVHELDVEPPDPGHTEPHAEDAHITTLEAQVFFGTAEATWTYRYRGKGGGTDEETKPEFYFIARIDDLAGEVRARSGVLAFRDTVEVRLKDGRGRPQRWLPFVVEVVGRGVRIEGRLDGDGYARLDDVPPGRLRIGLRAWGSATATARGGR